MNGEDLPSVSVVNNASQGTFDLTHAIWRAAQVVQAGRSRSHCPKIRLMAQKEPKGYAAEQHRPKDPGVSGSENQVVRS